MKTQTATAPSSSTAPLSSPSQPPTSASSSPSHAPPAPLIPTRVNAPQAPPQIIYRPVPPPPNMPASSVLALAILLGMGTVGVTSCLLHIVKVSVFRGRSVDVYANISFTPVSVSFYLSLPPMPNFARNAMACSGTLWTKSTNYCWAKSRTKNVHHSQKWNPRISRLNHSNNNNHRTRTSRLWLRFWILRKSSRVW